MIDLEVFERGDERARLSRELTKLGLLYFVDALPLLHDELAVHEHTDLRRSALARVPDHFADGRSLAAAFVDDDCTDGSAPRVATGRAIGMDGDAHEGTLAHRAWT